MVFIWYFNGNYIGGGMEELRHQGLSCYARQPEEMDC